MSQLIHIGLVIWFLIKTVDCFVIGNLFSKIVSTKRNIIKNKNTEKYNIKKTPRNTP